MKKTVQLFTPGLDSFLVDWVLNTKSIEHHKVYCVLSSKYTTNELNALNRTGNTSIELLTNMDLGIFEKDDLHIPHRNLLMLANVQAATGADELVLGGVLEDRVSDNNIKFYKAAAAVLSISAEKPIKIYSPLVEKEKAEWCKEYSVNNDELNLITSTYSCFETVALRRVMKIYKKFNGEYITTNSIIYFGCLHCKACLRKILALVGCGIYIYDEQLIKLLDSYKKEINYFKEFLPHKYKCILEYSEFIESIESI